MIRKEDINTFDSYRIENHTKESFLEKYTPFEEKMESLGFEPGMDFDRSLEGEGETMEINIEIYSHIYKHAKFDKFKEELKKEFGIEIITEE